MIIQPFSSFLALLLLANVTARGGLYNRYSGTDPMVGNDINKAIPDANPTGISDTIVVAGLPVTLSDVNVWINVSGQFNGDLYAYLDYNGRSVILLNRMGKASGSPFGSSTAGFGSGSWYNFKFDDSSALIDIHSATGTLGSPMTGTYNTDRRTADPMYVTDASTRGSSLSSFTGDPNGNWTLFFSDMASENSSTLVSWGMEITAVPEPSNVALGLFGGMSILALAARSRPARTLVQRLEVALTR